MSCVKNITVGEMCVWRNEIIRFDPDSSPLVWTHYRTIYEGRIEGYDFSHLSFFHKNSVYWEHKIRKGRRACCAHICVGGQAKAGADAPAAGEVDGDQPQHNKQDRERANCTAPGSAGKNRGSYPHKDVRTV